MSDNPGVRASGPNHHEAIGLISGGLVTDDDPHICNDDCGHSSRKMADVPHAVPSKDLERAITAIDQHYTVEDLGWAGDARMLNLRDQLTGAYLMTITLVHTPPV